MPNIIPELTTLHDKPAVTSRQIAEDFEKLHKHVIRDIEESEVSENFRKTNFGLSEYTVQGQTRKYKQYLLTRDGFTMVAMGFTGKKATAFKEAYIEAFNKMEAAIVGLHQSPDDYARITPEQRQQLAEAVRFALTGWIFGGDHHQDVYNRLRNEISFRHIEDMPASEFDKALAIVAEIREDGMIFLDLVCELRDWFLKERIWVRGPWTPHIVRTIKRLFGEKVPARPNWLEMHRRIEEAKAPKQLELTN